MPFLQAISGIVIPISLALIFFVKVPTPIALITLIPIAPTLITVAVEIAGLGDFGRLYNEKVRVRDYVCLILGTFPFQTEHSGVHREPAVASMAVASTAAFLPTPARAGFSELDYFETADTRETISDGAHR